MLKLTTDDLAQINSLNNAANRGDSLQEILHLITKETKKLFSCDGVTVYLVSKDKEYLVMQNLILAPAMTKKIEKIIGIKIPMITLPLKAGSLYMETLQTGKSLLINDPATIRRLTTEFTETVSLPAKLHKTLRKLVPRILQVLDKQSVIIVPFVSEGEAIGLLDIGRHEPFTKSDLHRLEIISGQLTAIIKHKQAEEALLKERNFTNTLVHASPAFFVAIGSDGKTIMMNDLMLDTLGYSSDEVEGRDYLYTFVPARDHASLSKVFEKLTVSHKKTLNENHILTKTGQELLVEWHGRPVFNEKGEFEYFFGVGIDITERKKAEEEIRESEEKYRTLTDNINVGVYRNTIGAEGRFIEVNPAIVKMFGYKNKNEFLKLKVADLYKNPKDRIKFNEKMISKGFVRNEEIQLQISDGTPFFGSVSAVAVKDEKGKVKYYDGIIEDITERKQAEEELKKTNEELSAFNRLVVDRELRMIELKSEINELLKKLGQEEKYKIIE